MTMEEIEETSSNLKRNDRKFDNKASPEKIQKKKNSSKSKVKKATENLKTSVMAFSPLARKYKLIDHAAAIKIQQIWRKYKTKTLLRSLKAKSKRGKIKKRIIEANSVMTKFKKTRKYTKLDHIAATKLQQLFRRRNHIKHRKLLVSNSLKKLKSSSNLVKKIKNKPQFQYIKEEESESFVYRNNNYSKEVNKRKNTDENEIHFGKQIRCHFACNMISFTLSLLHIS